jgi:tetratricopeptide repeat protein
VQSAPVSPYRNVDPSVHYVGDDTCAQCHPAIAETYRLHPMGRSVAPVSQSPAVEEFNKAANNPFQSLGFEFFSEKGPGGLIHKAIRRDSEGHIITETSAKIEFVVGSGTRGRSYLLNRDGYLFQSPISWYSQKNAWGLSPTFERFYPPERVVEIKCLFCHSNHAEAVEQTRNRYRAPIFDGFAIGCERCHGPGALHVEIRQRGDEPTGTTDDSIVNPRHLPPVLREAVCQQCHLQGEQRFLRWGRKPFDYRPGLPLHQSWAVFVKKPEFADQRAIGQVEQMYRSRCFQASKGKLGCISCHDPHALPAADQRVDYYRRRCLNCHQEQSCSLPLASRQKRSPKDNCVECHMPPLQTTDIAHTAIADHRISRQPDNVSLVPSRELRPGEAPIVNFYENELDLHDPSNSRDLGVALSYLTQRPGELRQSMGSLALPLLDKTTQSSPEAVAAWEALGWVLSLEGRGEAGLAAYETALTREPQRELTLALASNLAEHLGRDTEAIAYLRRLVAVNPWIWEYRYNFAKLLAGRGEWLRGLAEAEAALHLSPASQSTRTLLITCCIRSGKLAQAKQEFQKLLALNPQKERLFRSWFAEQIRMTGSR